MVNEIFVDGYEAYQKAVDEHCGKTIFVLFTGSPEVDGKSWCPDCVKADPVVKKNLMYISSDAVFICCYVGDRVFWKDQNNVFRKDSKLRLTSVPTLLKIGYPQQLQEEQCAKDDLIEMLFTED